MKDKKCEELAFPVLFPNGRYGYTTERKIHLTPTIKYFNARLLHHSGKFVKNPEYFRSRYQGQPQLCPGYRR